MWEIILKKKRLNKNPDMQERIIAEMITDKWMTSREIYDKMTHKWKPSPLKIGKWLSYTSTRLKYNISIQKHPQGGNQLRFKLNE
tara:strand:- start:678 stop:932 length:255 start_codon:yes stop_codon:yes gene_type:complete